MKKSEWNEERIEHLLQQLPSIKDRRTSKEIYQQLLLKQARQRTRKIWVAPTFAMIAAALILFLISPYLFDKVFPTQSGTEDSSMENTVMYGGSSKEAPKGKEEINQVNEEPTVNRNKGPANQEEKDSYVVQPEEEKSFVTIAFADKEGKTYIPVSFKSEKGEDPVEQIEEILQEIDEEKLGFAPNELVNLELSEQGGTIRLEFNKNLSQFSPKETAELENVITETFRWQGYEKAALYLNDKEGIDSGASGQKNELPIKPSMKKAYYVFQESPDKSKFLAPTTETFENVKEAILAMKEKKTNDKLKPAIVDSETIQSVQENGQEVIVTFSDQTTLENTEPYILMLEGIVLTAKEFGFEAVKFENIQPNQIGEMDLTKPVPVPFSPNPVE
ncbi:hypothetical protein [Metabacillus arenae]|uniref:Sigma-X negative effector n=1 Tax=Metabacillus arenae TaxID=2771434 RepID=A0A926NCJ8_9BACI|nr:hypothetical protein [Metabacillus arenae]MBD1378655.1 hypothetical protein [Metabacillus arenae]